VDRHINKGRYAMTDHVKIDLDAIQRTMGDDPALHRMISQKLADLATQKGLPASVLASMLHLEKEVFTAVRQASQKPQGSRTENELDVPVELPSAGRVSGPPTWVSHTIV
jgi:hypothetical protein